MEGIGRGLIGNPLIVTALTSKEQQEYHQHLSPNLVSFIDKEPFKDENSTNVPLSGSDNDEANEEFDSHMHATFDTPSKRNPVDPLTYETEQIHVSRTIQTGIPIFFSKYQFVILVFFLIYMYISEVVVDVIFFHRLALTTGFPTCIILGANFRNSGKTKWSSFSRLLTCTFIHLHIFHLLCNVISILISWVVLESATNRYYDLPGIDSLWCYSWTFPIFMFCAISGNVASYRTILPNAMFGLGASGGCLGIVAAYTTLTLGLYGISLQQFRRVLPLCLSIILSCFPMNNVFVLSANTSVDYAAHIAGSCCGTVIALLLVVSSFFFQSHTLILYGNIISLLFLVMVVFAYGTIFFEYAQQRQNLYLKVLVQYMDTHLDDTDDKEQKKKSEFKMLKDSGIDQDILDALEEYTSLLVNNQNTP